MKKTKQILIKGDATGFTIEVKGLSDIEVLGLLTMFKTRLEVQMLNQFVIPIK